MEETLRGLRRVLERGPEGRRGFPAAIRRRAATWARRRQADGVGMRGVAAELGISHETLRRWMKHGVSTFRRVQVDGPTPETVAAGVVLRLPGGASVEGLRVEDVVVVLRALT